MFSDDPELNALLEKARFIELSRLDRRAQMISFAVGNVLVDKPHYDEWTMRRAAAAAWDDQYGEVRE